MNLNLLYIDPGTGSALFSILIGIAATLYFLGRALLIKIKVLFSGKGTLSIYKNPYVIYSEGSQYFNVFKPVLDNFEDKKTEILYLTSAKDDPVFDKNYNYIKSEYIGEGGIAFTRLGMLSAKVCLMTSPGLNVYQLKRSKSVKHYSHVLHSPADAMTYKLFGLDYFDSVLLSGDYQANDIRCLEKLRNLPEKQLITVGCSYLDELYEKSKKLIKENNNKMTVLISPSWGESALLSRYGEKLLDPLCASDFNIIIRPHPQSKKSESALLEKLSARYDEKVVWDFEQDNIISLSKADAMISDFSGIIFDYMFLFDKPCFYVNYNFDSRPYDADDLDHELWQFKIIKEAGIELKENDFMRIAEIIINSKDNESLSLARKKASDTAWQYRGEAGKRIADFLLSIAKND